MLGLNKIRKYKKRKLAKHNLLNEDAEELYNYLLLGKNPDKLIKKRGIKIRNIDIKWLEAFWSSFYLDDIKNKKNETYITESIKKGLLNNCPLNLLIQLYTISLRGGLFKIGYHIRQEIIRKNYIENRENVNYEYAVPSLIENNRYDELNEYIDRNTINDEFIVSSINLLLKGNGITSYTKSETKFHDYVKQQDIVFVGPAKYTSELKENNIKNKILIHPNYKAIPNNNSILTKCDITTYTNPQLRAIIKKELEWVDRVSFILYQSDNLYKQFINVYYDNYKADISNKLIKRYGVTKKLKNFGDYNSLPKVIFQIYKHNPKSFYITKSDLMLTKEREQGYVPDELTRDKDFVQSFLIMSGRHHDPYAQYIILKRLFDLGAIEGDQRFREVMQLGVYNYMCQLQNIYGNYGRILKRNT